MRSTTSDRTYTYEPADFRDYERVAKERGYKEREEMVAKLIEMGPLSTPATPIEYTLGASDLRELEERLKTVERHLDELVSLIELLLEKE